MTEHVLTLLAADPGGLESTLVDAVRDRLFRLGATLLPNVWLAPDRVCDIPFADLNDDGADAAARALVGGRAIDCIAQPVLGRKKRLLIADMESTLIQNEMLDELADYVGLRDEIADVTARAMNGELDFEAAIDARVLLLRGLSVSRLAESAERIALMPGAAALIATMRAAGAQTALVSGGFRFYTALVAGRLGIAHEYGNELLTADGVLTGKVARPILGRAAKYDTLLNLAARYHLPLTATLAVGDGANDLDMLLAAGLGVAFHAKPAVTARAKWRIDHGDLTSLLYAQGYAESEIVPQ